VVAGAVAVAAVTVLSMTGILWTVGVDMSFRMV